MGKLIFFGILSIPVILVSWRTLFNFKRHGFYRFFSWECIIWLFVSNYKYWFVNPCQISQIIAWICLLISAYLIIAGIIQIKKFGKQINNRDDNALYKFEKTSNLVNSGIYKYIRHPLYSSLLFLTWGIFLKNMDIRLFIIAIISSFFLYITARFDEKECLNYFGENYSYYMKNTKRFIPFIF